MNLGKARRRLRIHAITVSALVLTYVVMAVVVLSDPGSGPTSGVVLLLPMLPLTVLGLPWSIPFWSDPYLFDGVAELLHHLIMVAPAVLNVLIHGAVHLALRSRAAKSDAH